jgi:predicted Zn-dependent protease
MKARLFIGLLAFLFLSSCSTVPLTGRKQLNMIPSNELMSMSYQQYGEFLKENPPIVNTPDALMVKNVGKNIQVAVEQYLANNNLYSLLDGYKWEFNLVNDPQVNAWCMPGGKVVVYKGILSVTQDETGLAVVMGHEIAHAIAEHGGERMSQELLRSAGSVGLAVALSDQPEETQALWMMAYGAGTEVAAILPYSRLHESEADHLGLIFMAMAGYNPEASVDFWQRMSASSSGQKPPEFLSTHPSDQTRIANLQKWMPEAMKYYSGKKSPNQNKGGSKKTFDMTGHP